MLVWGYMNADDSSRATERGGLELIEKSGVTKMKKLLCFMLLCLVMAGLFAKNGDKKLYIKFSNHCGDEDEGFVLDNKTDKQIADSVLQKIRDYLVGKGLELSKADGDNCYPYFSIFFDAEENHILDFHISFIPSKKADESDCVKSIVNLRAESMSSADEMEDTLLQYAKAHIAPLFAPPSVSSGSSRDIPELLDEHNGYFVSLAPRDDSSFVLVQAKSITDCSSSFEVRQKLEAQLPEPKPSTSFFESTCLDGHTVILSSVYPPYIVYLDASNNIVKKTLCNLPEKEASIFTKVRFLRNGEPYYLDTFSNEIYFLSNDGKPATKFNCPIDESDITAVSAGLDDEIWIQSYTCIFKYSKSSGLKSVLALKRSSQYEKLEGVLDDGSFITIDTKLKRTNRRAADGSLIWSYPLKDRFANSRLLASRNGMYYYTNNTLLWRLVEPDIKQSGASIVLRKNNKEQSGASLMEMARIYCENADALYKDKSYSSALEYYTKYLSISPADSAAAERKLMCEVEIGKKEASEKSEKALDLLDEYGEVTAQSEYSAAMMLLEKLRKQVPWDEDVQTMYAELKSAFNPGERAAKEDKTSLLVDSVELGVLFPALMNVYATNPAGFINVRNTGSVPLNNLKVSAFVRRYMDFASDGDTVATLKPGASAPVEIRTVLNQKLLSLTENTVLQMQLTLSWEEDGRKKSTSITRPVTVYKKSAMSWRDTGMLSCFVLPNDSSVSSFAFAAMDGTGGTVLSTQVTKAMRIANALGSLPLNYVADPATPLDQVIGNEFAVDTVRFPGETLTLKGGDCDDMTTLFCSLLESTGVPSAFVTVPSHIFAAFDTGLKYNEFWKKLSPDYTVIEQNGHVWIPVEVTVLNKGFADAWKTASKEIQTEGMELTELSEAWKVYAPVPADGSPASVSVNKATMNKMNDGSREVVVRTMTRLLDEATASKMKAKDLNSAAKLYHSMGQDDKAIAVLLKATEQDSSYEAAFANLASLYRKKGDLAKADLYAGKSKNVRSQVTSPAPQDGSSRASSSVEETWYE